MVNAHRQMPSHRLPLTCKEKQELLLLRWQYDRYTKYTQENGIQTTESMANL